MASPGELNLCRRYASCEVVVVPYIVDTILGGGWLLPKGSPYLPIMEYYVSAILEGGVSGRMAKSYSEGAGDPICHEYDGKPIGVHKAFSLCAIVFLGVGLSLLSLM
jgi:hypothetical protein